MTLRFTLNYRAEYGQVLVVCGSAPELGSWEVSRAPAMTVVAGDDHWQLVLELPDEARPAPLAYKYALRDERTGAVTWEWGPNRILT
ncbi:MAG TPA: CBM20 domain-containing protein, partial [bacterium]|nr:CBM20 domain-containing protein [bacterium]